MVPQAKLQWKDFIDITKVLEFEGNCQSFFNQFMNKVTVYGLFHDGYVTISQVARNEDT